MPRRPRCDKPGRLHHVYSRGQDRQRIFYREEDYRFFIALLGCAAIRRRIRLHAYCLMRNHFHLLVESVDGNLSATMQWILGRYGGYFNATHKHVGHVFGGRFGSVPVLSAIYLLILIRYIDRNPIKSRKPRDPLTLWSCSASHHARAGPHPRWLSRDVIDRFLPETLVERVGREQAYRRVFRVAVPDPAGDALVEACTSRGVWVEDELDLLVRMGPVAISDWLLRRARGDASRQVLSVALDAGSVRRALAEIADLEESAAMRLGGVVRRDVFPFLETGLLATLVGLPLAQAARVSEVSRSRAQQRYAIHRESLLENEGYRRLAGRVVCRALALAYPEETRAACLGIDCI